MRRLAGASRSPLRDDGVLRRRRQSRKAAHGRAGRGFGERGQVIVNHVSKGFLLPNNLERDLATRIEPLAGQVGDSVADVAPVATFENETVIEGVY